MALITVKGGVVETDVEDAVVIDLNEADGAKPARLLELLEAAVGASPSRLRTRTVEGLAELLVDRVEDEETGEASEPVATAEPAEAPGPAVADVAGEDEGEAPRRRRRRTEDDD